MKRYLLDTGPLAAYLHGRSSVVALVTPWVVQDEIVTSILAYGEVIEYLKGRTDFVQRRTHLLELLTVVEPYFLSYEILERYADIRRALRAPHGSGLIGDVDTLIAATALVHDLTVVTGDSDFLRVPELQVQVVRLRG